MTTSNDGAPTGDDGEPTGQPVLPPEGGQPTRTPMIARIKALLLTPRTEWPAIEAEQASVAALFSGYAMLLALVPAVASFLRNGVLGYGIMGLHIRGSIASALALAVGQYFTALIGVALIAFVIAFTAPLFGGISTRASAFRLAIYSATASWLAALFILIPGLSVLGLLGLYSAYLLYTGLGPVMKVPQDRAIPLTAIIVVIGVLLSVLMSTLMLPISGLFAGLTADTEKAITVSSDERPGEHVTVTLDSDKIKEASEKLAAAGKGEGVAKPVDPAGLKALLPAAIAGYQRGAIQSESSSAAGIGGSEASANYSANGRQVSIKLTDMAAMGALTGLGAALNVRHEEEKDGGFERTRTENGQIVSEKWDAASHSGEYSRSVANRFMISVNGEAESFDQLKAMGEAIDARALAALAR